MDFASSIHDLVHRLERSADLVDDLANSDWAASDENRDRLFSAEALILRVSRQLKKVAAHDRHLVARGLFEIRDALRECVRFAVCDDDDALAQLESLAAEAQRAARAFDEGEGLPASRRVAGGWT